MWLMRTTQRQSPPDDLTDQYRDLRRAVIACRVIGTLIVGSTLMIAVADLQPWDDRPWFWVFSMANYLGWIAGVLSALPILGRLYKHPRFALPALLFVISALLWSVSSLIPVPAGTIPTELSRSIETAGFASLYVAAVLATLAGWGTPLSPRD